MRIIGITTAVCVSFIIVTLTIGFFVVAGSLTQMNYIDGDIVIIMVAIPIAIVLTALGSAVFAVLLRMATRERSEKDSDAIVLMQDLHRGLTQMEKRVENLETLLLEREVAHR